MACKKVHIFSNKWYPFTKRRVICTMYLYGSRVELDENILILIARASSEGAKAQSRQSPHCLHVHAVNYASSPTY